MTCSKVSFAQTGVEKLWSSWEYSALSFFHTLFVYDQYLKPPLRKQVCELTVAHRPIRTKSELTAMHASKSCQHNWRASIRLIVYQENAKSNWRNREGFTQYEFDTPLHCNQSRSLLMMTQQQKPKKKETGAVHRYQLCKLFSKALLRQNYHCILIQNR